MAEGPVAAAVAGQLENNVADLRHLLVNVDLPREAEVFTAQLRTAHDRRQRGKFKGSRRMISRDIVGGVRPLGIAGHGDCCNHQAQDPPALYGVLHSRVSLHSIVQKKRRHERFAVRAGRPVTQTTPDFEGGRSTTLITGISTRYYRFGKKQIQKLKSFWNPALSRIRAGFSSRRLAFSPFSCHPKGLESDDTA